MDTLDQIISEAVERAEIDPLDGLVERTASNCAAPFVPETIDALVELKANNTGAFEALRAQLKKAGCRVTALDDAIAKEAGDVGIDRPTQADKLIELAASAELFHTADGTGYADIQVGGHRETVKIRAKDFKRWLTQRYYKATSGAPNSEALQSALSVIEAKAHYDAPERVVYLRVGAVNATLYFDLGDSDWRVVEINDAGWRIVNDPPVRFRRAAGMLPLPIPARGGSVLTLRSFLNVQSDADFVLAIAWLLACLRDRGPYPMLAVAGEQGSAKSTFLAILRALIDPNTAPLRALPREDRDLFIAATNGHVLAFDNVSGLAAWISDTLCRLATGGGFAVRQLYSDGDEVLFDAARPIMMNGIEDMVTRPDLADRTIFLTLEAIPEDRRRPEAEIWKHFEAERPLILGALLDAVVEGLKHLPTTRLASLPRMADFALWATACESALWPAGTFGEAYRGNRDDSVSGVIDSDPVAAAVRAFMTTRAEWTGTAAALLDALGTVVAFQGRGIAAKTWPATANALSGKLRRAATFLRKVGIDVVFVRGGGRERIRTITITTTALTDPESPGETSSASSASSAAPEDANYINGLDPPSLRTIPRTISGDGAKIVRRIVRANPLKEQEEDGADDADDDSAPLSGPEKLRGAA